MSISKVHGLKLRFDYPCANEKEAESLRRSILPESTNKSSRCQLRSSLLKAKTFTHLLLDFEAKDITSLRASANTNLRLFSSAIKTLSIAGKTNGAVGTGRFERKPQ
jgi:tRNA threonylcarbamoyladenosine modification (KEOPS) complex  Pcc1 subunit